MGDKVPSRLDSVIPSTSHEVLEDDEEEFTYEEIIDDIEVDDDDNELVEAIALLVSKSTQSDVFVDHTL